jgi:hypothetical protein
VRRFWETLLLNVALGNTTEAIWVGYSLEQFQSLQNANYQQLDDAQPRHPLAFPTCIPKQRLKFVENEVKRESRKTFERIRMRRVREHAGSPTHGNYITYLGPNVDRFVEVFKAFGVVVL